MPTLDPKTDDTFPDQATAIDHVVDELTMAPSNDPKPKKVPGDEPDLPDESDVLLDDDDDEFEDDEDDDADADQDPDAEGSESDKEARSKSADAGDSDEQGE